MTVDSKIVQPLAFFKVSEVDFASGRVSVVGWERAPDMSVVLEMRLEADASQQGSLFKRGKVSTRGCAVRKQVIIKKINVILCVPKCAKNTRGYHTRIRSHHYHVVQNRQWLLRYSS